MYGEHILMSNKLPGDPNLPPGCSNADIERNAGGNVDEENQCCECGEELTAEEKASDHADTCNDCFNED